MSKKKLTDDEIRALSLEELTALMSQQQIDFCEHYLWDYHITNAYVKAYKYTGTRQTASVMGNQLLRRPKIQRYIDLTKNNVAEAVGISKRMMIAELKKIAQASFSDIQNTWIDRKQFEDLDDDIKDAIQEITTRTVRQLRPTIGGEPEEVEVQQVKIKFYPKTQAVSEVLKSMGWNEAELYKVETSEKRIGKVNINRPLDD